MTLSVFGCGWKFGKTSLFSHKWPKTRPNKLIFGMLVLGQTLKDVVMLWSSYNVMVSFLKAKTSWICFLKFWILTKFSHQSYSQFKIPPKFFWCKRWPNLSSFLVPKDFSESSCSKVHWAICWRSHFEISKNGKVPLKLNAGFRSIQNLGECRFAYCIWCAWVIAGANSFLIGFQFNEYCHTEYR